MANTTLAGLLVKISADSSELVRGLKRAEGGMASLKEAAKQLGTGLTAGAMFKKFVDESVAAQNATAQLQAALASTGGAAGKSLGQLEEMAQALQRHSTFSDEAVKSAQSLLLTFKSIKGDEFDKATQVVADLATRMGGDLKGAALQVGKALEDPIKGLTALRRSGVSFNDEQREMIKGFVESGQLARAQKAILQELQVQFGGSAEAARNTLGGALTYLSNQWGELFEASRESSGGIIDAINAIADTLPKVRSGIDFVIKGWQNMGVWAAVMVEQLKLVARALDPRNLWSPEARAAFKAQQEALGRMYDAAYEMTNGLDSAAAATDGFADSQDRAAGAVSGLDAALAQLRGNLKGLGSLPTFSELNRTRTDISGAQDAAKDFMGQAGAKYGKGWTYEPTPTPAAPRSGAAGPANPVAQSTSALGEVVGQLKDFGSAIGGILSALNPWKILLDAIARACGEFIMNMAPIVELLASALMPILKALFPVFKLLAIAATYVGQVFFTVAEGIAKALGGLIYGIGVIVKALPLDRGLGERIKGFGNSLIDLGKGFGEASDDLGKARDEIKDLEWQDALDPLKNAANETAAALRNVPSGYKIALARFNATSTPHVYTGGVANSRGGGVSLAGATFNIYGVQNVSALTKQIESAVAGSAARGGAYTTQPAYQRGG